MKRILIVAALAMATTGFAQKAATQLKFEKGQKLQFVTDAQITSSMEIMGQPVETKGSSNLSEVYNVTNVDKAGTTLEHKIQHLSFNMNSAMGNQSFDSDKEEDRNGDIGKVFGNSLTKYYVVTIDPAGKVTAVKADTDTSAGGLSNDDLKMFSNQIGVSLAPPSAGDNSVFHILPNRAVKTGDTWADSTEAEGQKRKTVYTVKSMSDNEMKVDYTEDVQTSSVQNIMGMDATIKATNKGTGTITVDRQSGIFKQKTGTVETNGTLEVQGQSIPVKGTMNSTTMVKPAQ